jgi:uncharacterized protein
MLLMKEPSLTVPPENGIEVTGGTVSAFPVAKGQLLTVKDIDGGQPASLFGVTVADTRHFLSPHHTRVFSNSFILRLGMRVVTNRRRPAMVLGRDTGGAHDLLMPISEARDGSAYIGATDRFKDKVRAAFAKCRVDLVRVPDPINLFLNVSVVGDGKLVPQGVASKAGSLATFRVLMDLIVAVAAPITDERLWSKPRPSAIDVRVHNHVESA